MTNANVLKAGCRHYLWQTNGEGETVIDFCNHEKNPSNNEGNCTHALCPLSPPSEEYS